MGRLWLLALFLLLVPAVAFAFKRPLASGHPAAKAPPISEVPLGLVAAQVVQTLDTFNAEADSQSLPKLSKVVFDFNATGTKNAGFSFNILIFRVGASREVDTTNEVTFTYAVPAPLAGAITPKTRPATHDFSQTLLSTLQAAAAQVKQTQTIGTARFTDLTVVLSYGVIWDMSTGGDGMLSLVTLDGSVDRKRSDVQTLTLTFGP